MNKKKLLIIIGIIVVIAAVVVGIIGGSKGKSNTSLSKAEGDSLYSKLENILKSSNFTYDVLQNNGTNYGASSRVEYALSDGTVFEVYEFVEKSVVYESILDTGYMYLLGTETKYKVSTVKELNIAIKYLNEGSRIKEIKKILK
ncbi:MAG: hypothetical protein IKL68_05715 [Clostridia bacterium]|nr:hypothetical protein [Clostridia bacterium]